MVGASTAKAKILGLEITRTEIGRPGDFDAINSKEELAEKYLLEANPNAIVTHDMREAILAELERHMRAIEAIATDGDMKSSQQH